MKKCCLCGKVAPKDNLYYSEEEDENVHTKCVRKFMALRNPRQIMAKADKFAWMLVEKNKEPPR